MSDHFARQHHLQRISIPPRPVKGFDGRDTFVDEVVRTSIDVGGYSHRIFAYVVRRLPSYDIILGRPWLDDSHVIIYDGQVRETLTNETKFFQIN